MTVRIHGDMNVALARREELEPAIAEFLDLGVRAVKNRLEGVHGRTRLRVVFKDRWPAPRVELANITAATALELDRADAIAALVDLTPRTVRGRLGRARGNTLVGNVFADEWPSVDEAIDEEGDLDDEEEEEDEPRPAGKRGTRGASNQAELTDEELGEMRVADVRRDDLAGVLADRLELGLRRVRGQLRAAHGNVLIRNVFELPGDGDERPTSPVVTGPRTVGARALDPLVGALVGERYRIIRVLGEGGYGKAFEAEDTEFPEGGLVVLKFAAFDSLTNELKIAMRLAHENVCSYRGINFDRALNQRYLVVEHGGQSIEHVIRKRRSMLPGSHFRRFLSAPTG